MRSLSPDREGRGCGQQLGGCEGKERFEAVEMFGESSRQTRLGAGLRRDPDANLQQSVWLSGQRSACDTREIYMREEVVRLQHNPSALGERVQ